MRAPLPFDQGPRHSSCRLNLLSINVGGTWVQAMYVVPAMSIYKIELYRTLHYYSIK